MNKEKTKICSKCGEEKELDNFYKSKKYKYDRFYYCKDCYLKIRYPERYKKQKQEKKLFEKGLKKCSKCGEIKKLSEFNKRKTAKYGYRNECKNCKNKYNKEYLEKNKEKVNKKRNKKYVETNYYEEKVKPYKKKNKIKILKNAKNYRDKNKHKISWKLKKSISSGMLYSLQKDKNDNHWETLVGYNLKELENHLFKNNIILKCKYLMGMLHIDHIIPIASYNITSSDCKEFKKCWNLKNLRLLESKKNLSKQDKIIWELIDFYQIEDLLPDNLKDTNIERKKIRNNKFLRSF